MSSDTPKDKDEQSSNTPLLDSIQNPSDLNELSKQELRQLADELRSDLISCVSVSGGHFASSLGVVELTVALHRVFDTPHDRIVWDVGHQAYIHKILTGRRAEMQRIRKLGGISGFPKRDESPYDTFGVGHAGTSVSAAIGMLEASEHDYEGSKKRNVVAVIGDGAMTAGMAFEALNHSGQLHRHLIVILNDNEMSIAPNVGALSRAFSRTASGRFSTHARKQFKSLAERGYIPQSLYKTIDLAEEVTQGFFSAPSMLFASCGFRYIGPIDGHNIDEVIDALERAKIQDAPVLIHALTVKGKGYEPAEQDPVKYHGVGPFSITCGTFPKAPKPKPPTYTKVFGDVMVNLCKEDPRVVGITAAMPDGTGLTKLSREMPERFYDVGIAEQHAVTFAAGLACEGMRPVCAIYSTFLQRAFDQVVHDVGIQKLPVVFALDRGGMVGADGATHHGVFDYGYLRMVPNFVIAAPRDEREMRDLLYTGIAYTDGPFAFRYPRGEGLGVDLSEPPKLHEIGRGELLADARGKQGKIVLLGLGRTVSYCMEAASILNEQHGIPVSVFDARFLKPLDKEQLYELLSTHSLAVSVEDNVVMTGFGSAVLEFMSDVGLSQQTRLVRMGIPDVFIEQGTQDELYEICGFDTNAIVERVIAEGQASGMQTSTLKHSAVANFS